MNRIISKEKEREDIQGEILQRPHSNSNPRVSSEDPKRDSSFYTQSSILQINSIYRINSTTRNYKYKAHSVQTVRRHPPVTVPRVSKHSIWQNQAPRPLQHKQASGNSTRQKQHSTRQPAYTQPFQQLPGAYHKEST